jgi:hypothetical protein
MIAQENLRALSVIENYSYLIGNLRRACSEMRLARPPRTGAIACSPPRSRDGPRPDTPRNFRPGGDPSTSSG